jgi:hypothetical protein
MVGFRFRLYTTEMDELGEFVTAVPNWSKGDTFLTGEGVRYRILRIVPFAGATAAYNAMWQVERIGQRARQAHPLRPLK